MTTTISLTFPLDPDDGWPPVGGECLPFWPVGDDFEATVPPLFVKDLSVGDVIRVSRDPVNKEVVAWSHVVRSDNTTIWLLRLAPFDLDETLARLRETDCSTASLAQLGVHAVNVPAHVPIARVDAILSTLDEDQVAVAFPSMRHPEPSAA